MPSAEYPTQVVNPGPGKLPAGVVPASALLFSPSGGSGGQALAAHMSDPYDAHMAGAIGVLPIYPPTLEPLNISAGGVVDGESVLDFIAEAKDLFPDTSPKIGSDPADPWRLDWGHLDPFSDPTHCDTGGYANGTNVVFTKYLTNQANFVVGDSFFPADRGVVALYSNTNGNFFDSANTTLVAALWLGKNPPPVGIPTAGFNPTLRRTGQPNYVASGAGLDKVGLVNRLPHLSSYAVPPPWTAFASDFFAYQLGTFATGDSIALGGGQNWLLVHWKETYATALARIQPANLTALTLVAANCYTPVPVGGNLATIPSISRRTVFRDSTVGGQTVSFTKCLVAGVQTVIKLSGIEFYNNNAGSLVFDLNVQAPNLFNNSFLLGEESPPNVPVGFGTSSPLALDFSDFGAISTDHHLAYYELHPQGFNPNYSAVNAPQPGDVAEYTNAAEPIPGAAPVYATPDVGHGPGRALVKVAARRPWGSEVQASSAIGYMFNSVPQTGAGRRSTDSYEPFTDEYYRWDITYNTFTPGAELLPVVPDPSVKYNSNTELTVGGEDLQVVGGQLYYPHYNYYNATLPSTYNYATVQAGDGANHLRRYMRAFDTGSATSTGRIRFYGIPSSAFVTDAVFDGAETTGHMNGKVIIQLKVPGSYGEGQGTAWLDLGRAWGDPAPIYGDYCGCYTNIAVDPSGYITVTYNTHNATRNNGSGKFLLLVKVTYLNGNLAHAGSTHLTELQWLPPV